MMAFFRSSLRPFENLTLLVTMIAWLWYMMAPAAMGAEPVSQAKRIVSIGGSITEIVDALGESGRLVARDTTSNYPPEILSLPDIGYIRALSPEGVLSVNPDMILTLEGFGPPEAAEVLGQAGVKIVAVPEAYDGEGILRKVALVAGALGAEGKGEALSASIAAKLERTAKAVVSVGEPKRVMFVLTAAGGRIMAAGTDSQAGGIIRMAGGINAFNSFSGYKQVTDEAIIEAAPDVILMMDRTGDHGMTADALFAIPAFAVTPAAAQKALIKMDGMYLLGFGPRTPDAALELASLLYPGRVPAQGE